MSIYFGENEIAKKAKSIYFGVNGIARKAKAVYIGVGDIAIRVFPMLSFTDNVISKTCYNYASGTVTSMIIAQDDVSTEMLDDGIHLFILFHNGLYSQQTYATWCIYNTQTKTIENTGTVRLYHSGYDVRQVSTCLCDNNMILVNSIGGYGRRAFYRLKVDLSTMTVTNYGNYITEDSSIGDLTGTSFIKFSGTLVGSEAFDLSDPSRGSRVYLQNSTSTGGNITYESSIKYNDLAVYVIKSENIATNKALAIFSLADDKAYKIGIIQLISGSVSSTPAFEVSSVNEIMNGIGNYDPLGSVDIKKLNNNLYAICTAKDGTNTMTCSLSFALVDASGNLLRSITNKLIKVADDLVYTIGPQCAIVNDNTIVIGGSVTSSCLKAFVSIVKVTRAGLFTVLDTYILEEYQTVVDITVHDNHAIVIARRIDNYSCDIIDIELSS